MKHFIALMGPVHGRRSLPLPISPKFHVNPMLSCRVPFRQLICKFLRGLPTPPLRKAGITLGPGEDVHQQRWEPVQMRPPSPLLGPQPTGAQWHYWGARAADSPVRWCNHHSSRNRAVSPFVLKWTRGGPRQRLGSALRAGMRLTDITPETGGTENG